MSFRLRGFVIRAVTGLKLKTLFLFFLPFKTHTENTHQSTKYLSIHENTIQFFLLFLFFVFTFLFYFFFFRHQKFHFFSFSRVFFVQKRAHHTTDTHTVEEKKGRTTTTINSTSNSKRPVRKNKK